MNEKITLSCKEVRLTDKAALLDFEEVGETWIPLSQISRKASYPQGGIFEITIPEWLAVAKGLIEDA